MRKNGLLPEGREERGAGVGGEEGREGGKKGIVRQLCLFSESGGTHLALSLVLGVHLEREGGHTKPWLLSALSLVVPCPWPGSSLCPITPLLPLATHQ